MTATKRSGRRLRPLVLSAAALAGAAAAGPYITRRRRAVAAVRPDIRSPILYAPLSLRSDVVLRLIRRLPAPPSHFAPGVDLGTRHIRTPDGHEVRVLVYEPADRARESGALLWIHGGGTVMGRPEQGNTFCSMVAADLGLLVVSVDYRLAPDHPFPAGLDDCYTALEWLRDGASFLRIDADRIAVGGDSAGGGLAAALCQMARDRGGPGICFQLLEYPMLDDRTVLRGGNHGEQALIWTPTSNRYAWTAYLGHPPDEKEDRPYAVAARCPDLSNLPPAWIGVGDIDLFHDEDIDYARRLEAAGVPCTLHIEPGMYHGADSVLPRTDTSLAFRTRMVDALRTGFEGP